MANNIAKKFLKETFCNECSLQFHTKSVFSLHLSIVHKQKNQKTEDSTLNSKSETICNICSLQYGSKSEYAVHLSIVHEKKNQLKEESNTLSEFEAKRRKISFVCEICDVSFTSRPNLNDHITSDHEEKKNIKCHLCDTFWPRACECGPISELVDVDEGHPNLKKSTNMMIFEKYILEYM